MAHTKTKMRSERKPTTPSWDGKRIAMTSNGQVFTLYWDDATKNYRLFDLQTGKMAKRMTGPELDSIRDAGKIRDVFSRPGA